MKYNIKFNITDKVYIKELKIFGKICGIYITKATLEYNVRYFVNSEPKTLYFLEDELSENEETINPPGFKT